MTYFSDLPLTVARVLKPETWFTPSDPETAAPHPPGNWQDVSVNSRH